MSFVQALANCRKFGVDSDTKSLSFQPLRIGTSIAFYTALEAMSTRTQMLRITRNANGEVVFRVSGQLIGENVAEMEALIAAEKKGRRIVLDCADLRSVDGEAVKFLEKWEADSIKLKNCGLYIREWIRRQRLERKSGKSPNP
jgi:anti-anti-sigma regulatory factor